MGNALLLDNVITVTDHFDYKHYVTGTDYLYAKDQIDDWVLRVAAARKESTFAISRGIFAEVCDKRKGVIPNNYAAKPGYPDYESNKEGVSVRIYVENEKAFLLSLANIGAIQLFARLDSFHLRPHEGWQNIKKDNSIIELLMNF